MGIAYEEKRRFLRHPLNIPVEVLTAKDKPAKMSTSTDLSQGGMSFYWHWKLPVGVPIDLTVPVKDQQYHVKSLVSYSEEDPGNWRFLTGVSFTEYPPEFQARLAEEFLEILEYREKLSRERNYQVYENDAAEEWLKKNISNGTPTPVEKSGVNFLKSLKSIFL